MRQVRGETERHFFDLIDASGRLRWSGLIGDYPFADREPPPIAASGEVLTVIMVSRGEPALVGFHRRHGEKLGSQSQVEDLGARAQLAAVPIVTGAKQSYYLYDDGSGSTRIVAIEPQWGGEVWRRQVHGRVIAAAELGDALALHVGDGGALELLDSAGGEPRARVELDPDTPVCLRPERAFIEQQGAVRAVDASGAVGAPLELDHLGRVCTGTPELDILGVRDGLAAVRNGDEISWKVMLDWLRPPAPLESPREAGDVLAVHTGARAVAVSTSDGRTVWRSEGASGLRLLYGPGSRHLLHDPERHLIGVLENGEVVAAAELGAWQPPAAAALSAEQLWLHRDEEVAAFELTTLAPIDRAAVAPLSLIEARKLASLFGLSTGT